MESETSRCSKIATNLLHFSRKSKPELSEVNVNELVLKCIELGQHKLTLQNVVVQTRLDPTFPASRRMQVRSSSASSTSSSTPWMPCPPAARL